MLHIEQEIFELDNNLLKVNAWDEEWNLLAGFTTKNGGVSKGDYDSFNQSFIVGDNDADVLANRKQLAQQVGVPYEQWIFTEQKHTNNIQKVTAADCGAGTTSFESGITNTDGMYTSESGIVLAAFYADCTPVYFYAPKKGLIGLVHAGWQGSVKGIAGRMVRIWKEIEGVKPSDIQILIGPSAQFTSYEVGIDVAQKVVTMELDDARDSLKQMTDTTFKLDVPYLNYLQLVDEGVPADNIVISSYCSIADKDLFYSFRREGTTGRMLAYFSKKG